MLHETATDDMLYELTGNTGQGHWTIVEWICLITFLVNRVYIDVFPKVRERLLMKRCLEKQSKDMD